MHSKFVNSPEEGKHQEENRFLKDSRISAFYNSVYSESLADDKFYIKGETGSAKSIPEAHYKEHEKLLRKYEGEVRNHIKIELQLKIYLESLQEKLDEANKAVEALKLRGEKTTLKYEKLKEDLDKLQQIQKTTRSQLLKTREFLKVKD
mmetsp:Transcript_37680/g.57711  ORF Transcript_37680/g.57711 Transcript_37680/m.57711 type:complete len:149 (-) Transcript_37680:876-1322(-)